jgi:membrane fusion protein (multidrug efflux system)
MNTHATQTPRSGHPTGADQVAPDAPAGHEALYIGGHEMGTVTQFPGRATHVEPAAPAPEVQEERTEKRFMKAAIIALLVLVAGVGAWVAMRTSSAPPAAAAATANSAPIELAAVDVATVEPRVLSRSLPLSGSMSPIVQATVKSKVGGEVQQVLYREGQDVREGEVIARIDTRNLQAQYDRELAAVDKARADLELATLNRDKNRTLLEQKYISQNTYEATESAYAGNIANLKLAEAQLRLAKISLDDAVIRAPFSGTIARRLVQPGEKVSMDSEIVTLVDLKQMVLEAAVPAAEIPSVGIGQKARFTVGGFGAREFEGQVQRINPVTTEGSRSIAIYITVPNADRSLKGGMFAQGDLVLTSTQPVLSVGTRAVHEDSGVKYVYTLDDGKIARTPITLGAALQGSAFVEVREGLSAGDRVIVANLGELKAGATALIRGESAAENEVARR